MIDPKLLRNNIEAVNLALAKRGVQLNVAEWQTLKLAVRKFSLKLSRYKLNVMLVPKQVGRN